MNIRKTNTKTGFTIVELLIVIVVIGILAAITVVAYNGIQHRANNAARFSEFKAWQRQFELYRAQEGHLPVMPAGGYCLGSGFPNAKCRDYQTADPAYGYPESNNAALMTELGKVGTLPSGQHIPVNGTVGPYVEYYSNGTNATMVMVINGAPADCPDGTIEGWTDNAGRTLCYVFISA